MTKTRLKLYVVLAVLVVAAIGFQSYGGFQRDPRDVTFDVSWKTGHVVTVNWRGPNGASGNPSVTGQHWTHDITLPGPGTWTLVLHAVATPIKATDSHGQTFFRGAAVTCKIISHNGTASNVSTTEAGRGCSVTKVVVVPPDQ